MFKLDLEKAKEPDRDQVANICWITAKARKFQKKSTSALLTLPNPLTCGSQQTMKFSSRDGNTRPPYLPPEKSVCRSRRKLEPDLDQWTGSKLGKEYVKTVYCHAVYLTYMQSTSCEMPGWMKQKLESRLPGEISITSDMQMTPPLRQKAKRN